MKHPIESMVLCAALLLGSVTADADETADAAATPSAPSAPAAPAADEDKGVHVKIDVNTAESDDAEDSARIAVDADMDADEDDGPLGRVIRKGVAEILEEHVLTREDLDAEDREEVIEAIAELRGKTRTETRAAVKDIGKNTGRNVKDAVKEKRALVINNPMGHSADDDFGPTQAFVASLAIIFSLGMPIIIVAIVLYFTYRRRRLAHDTINQFLASGKEIPPEIMQNLFKDAGTAATTPKNNLHKGTINTSIGLGMVIGFNAIDAEFLAAIGFIFLLVGLAQLLIWKLEQGKKSEGDSTQG